MIHFLVVEVYELPKSTSHVLRVPSILECVRILSWSIFFFFYFNCLPDVVLCKIAIWADDTALNSSSDKPSDSPQQVEIGCNLILKIWKCNTKNIRKFNSASNLILKIWKCNTKNMTKCNARSNYILIFGKLFYIYKLIHIDLKRRMLIALFFASLLNN